MFPARLTLVPKALSAALAGVPGRLEAELPQAPLPVVPPQLLPEVPREELNEELREEELKEERPPPPLEPRARLS